MILKKDSIMNLLVVFGLTCILPTITSGCVCDKVYTQDDVNITEFIRKTWYIQKQQINGYQKENQLNCVAATYNIDNNSKVPFFKGKVLTVYNYANQDKVNGPSLGNNKTYLCARMPDQNTSGKLLVAPCFLPNIFGGPYWILYAGPDPDNYLWAIVIGGQPTMCATNTTNTTSCTTKLDGINNSGLWIFSREKVSDKKILDNITEYLVSKGINTEYLIDVVQEGCNYTDAYIK